MPTSTPRRRPAPKAVEQAGATVTDIDDAPPPVEFTVEFERDGEPEPHTFRARPRFTFKRMNEAAKASRDGGLNAVLRFEKMIRPSLVDTDGTPARWTPVIEDGEFEDWNGDVHDMEDLPALLAADAGSSKRRWQHLMDDDDDLEITIEEIVKVYELLIGAATDRPTRRSKSS